MINVESLREQLKASEVELEEAKAHVYRCDGVIRMLQHLIAEAEKPEKPSEDEKPTSV